MNIQTNLKRKAHQFQPEGEKAGACVIVGGAPSINQHVEDIRGFWQDGQNRILCLNAAHDWLIERGMPPYGVVFMEVAKWPERFLRKPRKGVTYYIASCCHPGGYERLAGHKIVQWHCRDDVGEKEILGDRLLIGGGSRAGLRAILLGGYMGFKRFEIFGMDSSFTGSSHAYHDEPEYQEDRIRARVLDKEFTTTRSLLRQANDFAETVTASRGLQFRVWGDGLLRHIHEHMQPEIYQ